MQLNVYIINVLNTIHYSHSNFVQNIYEIILETVNEYDFPVVFDFPAGHGEKNYPIILGRKIKLDVTKKQASIIFSN